MEMGSIFSSLKLLSILKSLSKPFVKFRDACTKESKVKENQELDSRIDETDKAIISRIDKNTNTFRYWDRFFQDEFFPDDQRSTVIGEIQRKIAESDTDACQFLHVAGVPGVGKSRLVYEAVSQSRGRIFSTPEEFWTSEFRNVIGDERFCNETLVIDECNRDEAQRIKKFLTGNRNSLHIITISPDSRTYEGEVFEIGKLPPKIIEKMFLSLLPGIDRIFLIRLVEHVDGNPRAVELFAKHIKANPDKTHLPHLSYSEFIKRLILGERSPDSSEADLAERVLTCFSIVTRAPHYDGNEDIRPIAEMLDLWDDGRMKQEAQAEIRRQKERKVLQGEKYLYVSPLPLKLYLFRKWEQEISEKQFKALINALSEDMKEKFFEHLGLLGEQSDGQNFAKDILGDTGPFRSGDLLQSEEGAKLFSRLTGMVPETALETLEQNVGTWGNDKLLNWHNGRQNIVWALEKIVVHELLFERGMKILLRMSINENADNTNNSTGTWVEEFQVNLAGTQADLETRKQVLLHAIEASDERSQRVGLKGIEHGLSLYPQSRMLGAEFQADKVLKLYSPAAQEAYEYRLWLWQILTSCLLNDSFLAKKEAKDILINNFRGLVRKSLEKRLVDDIQHLHNSNILSTSDVISATKDIIAYDKDFCPSDFYKYLEQFLTGLFSTDFKGRLNTLVQHSEFRDEFEERDELVEEVRKLASEALSDIDEKLLPHLGELLTYETELAFWFGKFIGESDTHAALLESILSQYRGRSTKSIPRFILGYFVAIKERNEEEYTKHVKDLINDKTLAKHVPAIAAAVGLNDIIMDMFIEALQSKKYTDLNLFNSFRYGGELLSISEGKFLEWHDLFNKMGTPIATDIIFSQFYVYFVSGQPDCILPYDESINLLTSVLVSVKNSDSYKWKMLAKKVLTQFPDTKLKILELIYGALEKAGSNYNMHSYGLKPVAAEIIAAEPVDAWKITQKYLAVNLPYSHSTIAHWLQGSDAFGIEDEGLIIHIPWTELKAWIDLDIENRAWQVASQFVPHVLTPYGVEPKSHARNVLECYGEREDVLSNLSANFSSGGWAGSEVRYWENKTKILEEILETEKHPNVRKFLKDQIERQEMRKENALIDEEQRGY